MMIRIARFHFGWRTAGVSGGAELASSKGSAVQARGDIGGACLRRKLGSEMDEDVLGRPIMAAVFVAVVRRLLEGWGRESERDGEYERAGERVLLYYV